MTTNSEIYLIGLAVLTFLIIVFLYIRKISNSGKLKLRIEEQSDTIESTEIDINNQQSFEYENSKEEQELAILNLISVDRSMYDIEQIFGFLTNYGAKINNKFFSFNNEFHFFGSIELFSFCDCNT